VLGHFFFEYLLEDDLHALAHSGFHVQLDIVFELVSRGQVSPFSLETHNLPDTIRVSTGLWPSSWYSKNAVKDVGFMVNEAPPSTRGAAFLLQWSPSNTKGGSRYGPRNGKVVFRR
jgi:hypothetical protein